MKKILAISLIAVCFALLSSCSKQQDNSVLIYSSAEDFRNEFLQEELNKKFPDYKITIEYMPSGNQASKIYAEGKDTACDIGYDLDFGYMYKIKQYYAVNDIDQSLFTEDSRDPENRIVPENRNGGCIAINTKILEEKGLPEPESYEDLLNPIYKGLVSMPNPKSSGTGYMFLKSLVNSWGEDKAFAYFDELSKNILQFTSSGSGPINALVQGEAAIGLAMTGQAVTEINNGAPLKILFFSEGSPYGLYGMGIIEGKQGRNCVKEVFEYMATVILPAARAKYYPEKIFADKDFSIENYPSDIVYADMSNNSGEEKARLLEKWNH
ncbi:MAG: extracellular solute-binding protein [Candidatus Cloacimonetes bacterium]|nr:extracellular solute-binding protein [Candidatus Cloacimonadota bacterium]